MRQYNNVIDNRCPACGSDVSIYNTVHLGEHVRVDSTCTKCGHSLMTLYHIESIVDEDAKAYDGEINWGHATEEDLHKANYIGAAYMAVPYYFYRDDRYEDTAGKEGYYYKTVDDIKPTIADIIRGMGKLPEEGATIGMRIFCDYFDSGETMACGDDNDIWFDDEKGEWNRSQLIFF